MAVNKEAFEVCPDRRGTSCFKWDRWEADVIPLWVADMDVVSAQPICDALAARVRHGVFGYAHESDALRNTVISWLSRRHNWEGVRPEWLVFVPGIVSGMNCFVRAVGGCGDSHLCHVPSYPPFLYADHLQARITKVPLSKDGGQWGMNLTAMAEMTDHTTKSFILCHPHNPCGREWTTEELREVGSFCRERGLYVLSDEIWSDLVLDGKHVPFAVACPEAAERTVTLMAPSKTFNIAGLACSVAIIPDKNLRARFSAAAQGIVPHINCMGLVAAEAAWGGQCDAWLDALLDHLRDNRKLIAESMARMPKLHWTPPQATYLAWIDARDALPDGVKPEKVAEWLAENYMVGLNEGTEFAAPGWLRLNFGCPTAQLVEALKRIEKAFGSSN